VVAKSEGVRPSSPKKWGGADPPSPLKLRLWIQLKNHIIALLKFGIACQQQWEDFASLRKFNSFIERVDLSQYVNF